MQVFVVQQPLTQLNASDVRWGDYYGADYNNDSGNVVASVTYAHPQVITHHLELLNQYAWCTISY